MDPQFISDAVSALSRGRLEHIPLELLSDSTRPSNEAEAYQVQAELSSHLTAKGYGQAVGRKIGCTTAVMQEYLRIPNPCAGFVYEPTVRRHEGEFDFNSFHRVGVECEIAVLLGEDLPSSRLPYDRSSVAIAVEAVMAGIEVVDDRWVDYGNVDVATLIADDFFGAGCVLGDPVTSWRDLDLSVISGSMFINGVDVGSGVGGDIMGHPFEALAWLANTAAEFGFPLMAGEFVLLGSIVQTKWLDFGDQVVIDIEGLGQASARFGNL